MHRINRAGVKSHPWFMVLVPFLNQLASGCGIKKVNFQQISVPKTFCISAAFLSRDFLKFKIPPSFSALLLFQDSFGANKRKRSFWMRNRVLTFLPLFILSHFMSHTEIVYPEAGVLVTIRRGWGCAVQISWITCEA